MSVIATIGGQWGDEGKGKIVDLLAEQVLDLLGKPHSLIQSVPDRPGHDRRYAVDSSRLRALGWAPAHPFAEGVGRTVRWYVEHEAWWRPLQDADYQEYYRRNYGDRTRLLQTES